MPQRAMTRRAALTALAGAAARALTVTAIASAYGALGMPGPPQHGQPVTNIRNGVEPALARLAWTEVSLHRPGHVFLRIRGHQAAQDANLVCPGRGPTAVCLCWSLDTLAWRARPQEAPVVGQHELFGFLTTEANAVVAPIHPKAMPVILTAPEEVDLWLEGQMPEALELQRPLPDASLKIVAKGEKEDMPPVLV